MFEAPFAGLSVLSGLAMFFLGVAADATVAVLLRRRSPEAQAIDAYKHEAEVAKHDSAILHDRLTAALAQKIELAETPIEVETGAVQTVVARWDNDEDEAAPCQSETGCGDVDEAGLADVKPARRTDPEHMLQVTAWHNGEGFDVYYHDGDGVQTINMSWEAMAALISVSQQLKAQAAGHSETPDNWMPTANQQAPKVAPKVAVENEPDAVLEDLEIVTEVVAAPPAMPQSGCADVAFSIDGRSHTGFVVGHDVNGDLIVRYTHGGIDKTAMVSPSNVAQESWRRLLETYKPGCRVSFIDQDKQRRSGTIWGCNRANRQLAVEFMKEDFLWREWIKPGQILGCPNVLAV